MLDDGNFGEAFNLLGLGSSEGIQTDVLLYNTILKRACDEVPHLLIPCKRALAHIKSKSFSGISMNSKNWISML